MAILHPICCYLSFSRQERWALLSPFFPPTCFHPLFTSSITIYFAHFRQDLVDEYDFGKSILASRWTLDQHPFWHLCSQSLLQIVLTRLDTMKRKAINHIFSLLVFKFFLLTSHDKWCKTYCFFFFHTQHHFTGLNSKDFSPAGQVMFLPVLPKFY